MAQLDSYLERKAAVLAQRQQDFSASPQAAAVKIAVSSKVAGITGARPTRMGENSIVTDSAPGLAGHALGPSAPEMLLGALASCLVHSYLIQAALLNIPLDHVEVEVNGELDLSGVIGLPYEHAPRLSGIRYAAQVESPAAAEEVARLHEGVSATCPVLNTLRYPVDVQRVE